MTTGKKILALLVLIALTVSSIAFAAEGGAVASEYVAVGAGIAVSFAVAGAALGQGKAVAACLEAIGRNPGAAGQLTTPLIIGLVFMEALGILAFVVAFLLQGKI